MDVALDQIRMKFIKTSEKKPSNAEARAMVTLLIVLFK